MKLITLEHERPGFTAVDFQPLLQAEAARAWELYRQGVIRELYFRADRHTAVLVLECPDAETARAALDTLPLVKEGLIELEILPLEPYTGFARLFGDQILHSP